MKKQNLLLAPALALILSFSSFDLIKDRPDPPKKGVPVFSNVVYEGNDDVFTENPLEADEFYNPILQGCYPDPAITRKGDDYYLVASSFAMFPG